MTRPRRRPSLDPRLLIGLALVIASVAGVVGLVSTADRTVAVLSARDTLSILDQLLSGSDERGITYQRAIALLGYTDADLLDEIVDAFARRDGAAVFQTVHRVIEGGHDPRRFATDLLERFRDLVVLANVPDAAEKGLLDRPEDEWPRRWAEAYVGFCSGEKRAWLHEQGMRWLPNPGWPERGGYLADGHGNSVPRFHITWGTGPGVVAPFERRVREAVTRGLVQLRFRHRVDELVQPAAR